jgi:hypothetical protein
MNARKRFFSRIHAQRIIVLSRRRNCYNVRLITQRERIPHGHKPANQLNTTRKINSNTTYSHCTQPKRLALSIALRPHAEEMRGFASALGTTILASLKFRPPGHLPHLWRAAMRHAACKGLQRANHTTTSSSLGDLES